LVQSNDKYSSSLKKYENYQFQAIIDLPRSTDESKYTV